MELPINGRLGQDAADGVSGGIGFDGQGELRLEVLEDGSRSEVRLERTKSCTCLIRPGKLNSLASQSSKRGSKSTIMKNEFSVKISKTQKCCTSLIDFGMGQFRIADTLAGSMPIPALETI